MSHSLDPSTGETAPDPPPRRVLLAREHAGTRLDLFLAAELALSRSQVRRLLEKGAVRLDGRRLGLADKGRETPGEGCLEVETWRPPEAQRIRPSAEPAQIAILAEGEGWVAVDKPAGLPVHPLREEETASVLGALLTQHPELQGVGEGGLRSGVVHRLDVDTSGVLLVATEQRAWLRLRTAFQEHRVEKTYRAIVAGRFAPPGGVLETEMPLIIARHRPAVVRAARPDEVARGRARTIRQKARPLEDLREATLVEVCPETGFLHQIRATMAHAGHPLLGDARYAASETGAGAPRHMLHAARVEIDEIDVSCPDPEDFAAVLSARRPSGS